MPIIGSSQTNTELDRPTSPYLDRILGLKFPVLNGQGHIRVIDYMGTEASIVQAARVSYGAGTKTVREDTGLLRFLMRNHHGTPFEMCSIKLHWRVPMDAWRQIIRHRVAKVNEYSTRYSEAIDATQATQPNEWRLQSGLNKQGSDGFLDPETGGYLSHQEAEFHQNARNLYELRLKAGVAREQARKDLPLCNFTEAYWKMDLRNLLHFLGLRMDPHAQKEVREYATVIGEEIVARWVPNVWQAFKDYQLEAKTISRQEQVTLTRMRRNAPGFIRGDVRRAGLRPATVSCVGVYKQV